MGETIDGYTPPGILDGIGAFKLSRSKVRVLVNHELVEGAGYAYTLANGTALTGARVSYFDIDRQTRGVCAAGLAYDTMYDRCFEVVTDPEQINEDGEAIDGIARFCSSIGFHKGEFGFRDNIYFTGEETGIAFHPHGGTEWVIDVDNHKAWALPASGRAAWENLTALNVSGGRTALLIGDDSAPAPLYLYIGEKNASEQAIKDFYGFTDLPTALSDNFLNRHGLLVGQLYYFRPDGASMLGDPGTTPEDFNGTGSVMRGKWVAIDVRDAAQAGQDGHDDKGFKNIDTLQDEAYDGGAFQFSRPEDVATNPRFRKEAVLASTGRGQLFPSENWGTTYTVITNFISLRARIKIIYDGDDADNQDDGIRSPDNLDWADDGYIYIQEDRSTSPSSLFGGTSGEEASIWRLHPRFGRAVRIAQVNRDAALPGGQTDNDPDDLGDWETSGVLDVTKLFQTKSGERLLIVDVQAHSVRDGSIGGSTNLVQGGQLSFLSKKRGRRHGRNGRGDDGDDDD